MEKADLQRSWLDRLAVLFDDRDKVVRGLSHLGQHRDRGFRDLAHKGEFNAIAALVADHMTFWLEKNPNQRTIWQPEMTVSREYFAAVREGDRLAPFYWPAMLALQNDTRAMDIHCFLTYRLRNGLKRPVMLHAKVLHALFGQDIKDLKKFWQIFKKSLLAAHAWYPQAQIEMKNDCIILKDSPPLIPYRRMRRIGQNT